MEWPTSVATKLATLTKAELKQRVLDVTIASAAWDNAATSSAGKVGDPYIQTDQLSNKVFFRR